MPDPHNERTLNTLDAILSSTRDGRRYCAIAFGRRDGEGVIYAERGKNWDAAANRLQAMAWDASVPSQKPGVSSQKGFTRITRGLAKLDAGRLEVLGLTSTTDTVLLSVAREYYKRARKGSTPAWRVDFAFVTADELRAKATLPDVGDGAEVAPGPDDGAGEAAMAPPPAIPGDIMAGIRADTRPMVENFIRRENAIGGLIEESPADVTDKIADAIGRMLEHTPPEEWRDKISNFLVRLTLALCSSQAAKDITHEAGKYARSKAKAAADRPTTQPKASSILGGRIDLGTLSGEDVALDEAAEGLLDHGRTLLRRRGLPADPSSDAEIRGRIAPLWGTSDAAARHAAIERLVEDLDGMSDDALVSFMGTGGAIAGAAGDTTPAPRGPTLADARERDIDRLLARLESLPPTASWDEVERLLRTVYDEDVYKPDRPTAPSPAIRRVVSTLIEKNRAAFGIDPQGTFDRIKRLLLPCALDRWRAARAAAQAGAAALLAPPSAGADATLDREPDEGWVVADADGTSHDTPPDGDLRWGWDRIGRLVASATSPEGLEDVLARAVWQDGPEGEQATKRALDIIREDLYELNQVAPRLPSRQASRPGQDGAPAPLTPEDTVQALRSMLQDIGYLLTKLARSPNVPSAASAA